MRLVVLTVLTVLLLPFNAPRVQADDVKYKSRPQPPDDEARYKRPSYEHPQYKPPDNRPQDDRPDDRMHADKPVPFLPPDPGTPFPPPPEPIFKGWPGGPPCTPDPWAAPVDWNLDFEPMPVPPDHATAPGPIDISSVLARTMRPMQLEGFTGEVVVGFNGMVEINNSYGGGGYYEIGTATEAFTAWAVYTLLDAGKVTLTTTLGQLLPGAPRDKQGITVEQLLGHTSGLGNTYAADGETFRGTAVNLLLQQPLIQPPGREYFHSDDGYVVLAAVIEVVSGVSYESYMLDCGAVTREAGGIVFWDERGPGRGQGHWGKRGSGGLRATAHDLYVWASRFIDRPGAIGNEIMRPRTWTDTGVGIGYGWFSQGDMRWTSGTSDSDDNVIAVAYPYGAILVVTSNRYYGDVPWSERVADALEPVLREWIPNPRWPLHPPVVSASR